MFVWSSFQRLISNTLECKQVGVDADAGSSLESGAVNCAGYGTFFILRFGIELAAQFLAGFILGFRVLIKSWKRKSMSGRVLNCRSLVVDVISPDTCLRLS